MKTVTSFEELRLLVASVRDRRQGFMTNLYLDEKKHLLWIEKNVLSYVIGSMNTLFVIKQSENFWNVFYCATDMDALAEDLREIQHSYSDTKMMMDIVGRKIPCDTLSSMLEKNGFHKVTSLMRMTRPTVQNVDCDIDMHVEKATVHDMEAVCTLLYSFFDETIEQLPFMEELVGLARNGNVLLCREQNQIAGFLIYEQSASTQYLRYWFTHPDFRDQGVGSALLRSFFREGKGTQRQIFWVLQHNENAIVRYKHYGFKEDNMLDYVFTNKL